MKSKHIAFAVLIVVLISVAMIYSRTSLSITGAVTASDVSASTQSSFGNLIFNPGFKADLPFDFVGDFSYLAEKAEQLKKRCEKNESVANCVQVYSATLNSDDLSLSVQCGNLPRASYEQFMEQLLLCRASKNNACSCRIGVPPYSYTSLTLSNTGMTHVAIEDTDGTIHEFDDDTASFLLPGASYTFFPGQTTDWVKDGDILQPTNNIDGIPSCAVRQENFRFCLGRSDQVNAYDISDGENALRNVYYRFALHIPPLSS